LSFFGEFMALYKQTEVSSAWRPCCKAPAETLVAHNPCILNDLRGRKSKLPPVEQPRWDENDCLHELRACNLTYYYPDTGRGIRGVNLMLPRAVYHITGRIGAARRLLRTAGVVTDTGGAIYWNGRIVTDPANFFVPPLSAYTPQIPQLFNSLKENMLLGLDKRERN